MRYLKVPLSDLCQNGYLNATDLAKAAKLGLGDHLVADLHVGATGAVAEAEKFFAGETAGAGAINCEVNAGIHTVLRGLTEAQVRQRGCVRFVCAGLQAGLHFLLIRLEIPCNQFETSWCGQDLNAFFNMAGPPSTSGEPIPRMKGRMASFCSERSGHLASHWDQGISFFAADRMWLQPPGWVHKMVHDTWQPLAARVNVSESSIGTCSMQVRRCSLLSL